MCDTVEMADGAELHAVGDLREYGFTVDEHLDDSDCLCHVDLAAMFAADTRMFTNVGWGDWNEIGADGKTWAEGYAVDKKRSTRQCSYLYRPDGRTGATPIRAWRQT